MDDRFCKTCNVSFTGPEPARQHYSSKRHITRLQASGGETVIYDDGDYEFNGINGYCHICKIQLSSEKHKNQHVNGEPHKKEAKQKIKMAASGGEAVIYDDGDYEFNGINGYCHICKIQLSSEKHKNQHVNGEPHKKEAKKKKKMAASGGEAKYYDDGDYEFNGINGYCHICKIQLSSEKHKNQHVNGRNHQKQKKKSPRTPASSTQFPSTPTASTESSSTPTAITESPRTNIASTEYSRAPTASTGYLKTPTASTESPILHTASSTVAHNDLSNSINPIKFNCAVGSGRPASQNIHNHFPLNDNVSFSGPPSDSQSYHPDDRNSPPPAYAEVMQGISDITIKYPLQEKLTDEQQAQGTADIDYPLQEQLTDERQAQGTADIDYPLQEQLTDERQAQGIGDIAPTLQEQLTEICKAQGIEYSPLAQKLEKKLDKWVFTEECRVMNCNWHCTICDNHTNSEASKKQHIQGKDHKKNLNKLITNYSRTPL